MSTRVSLLAGLMLAFLFACSPPPNVAVVERETIDERIETEKIGGAVIRIVQQGDTLHGIAFASGLDVNEVARWNNLRDTSRLQIGQRIRLTRPLNMPSVREDPEAVEPVSQQPEKPAKQSAKSTPAKQPTKKPDRSELRWSWPTQGRLLSQFGSRSSQQGIDIQGQPGQPVVASEAGEVVYVGNGLKGYGNLVIIKHNPRFLSAYAHNQETFVDEGQRVKSQSRIGSVGLNRDRRHALHFQIRKDGKPVNPMAYLPKR